MVDGVPPGFLVDTAWLARHGVSRQLTYRYAKSGWLERVARGLYRRPFSQVLPPDAAADWMVPLLSAQRIMGYDIHVGGPTALSLRGHSHYLPLEADETVYLYSDEMPRWLSRLPLQSELRLRKKRLFDDRLLGVENTDFGPPTTSGAGQQPWEWPVQASSPERAILEALDELPDNEGFHALDMAFEGLVSLRPRKLQALLESCRSVQVKRLFFVFADKHDHAWRKHLNPSEIDLGSGDRAFTKGGRLHPHYGITVPPEFLPQTGRDDVGA